MTPLLKSIDDMVQAPLLSIITPVYNRVEYIEKAIQSVLQQDFPNVEHLVIDGGSSDGTLEVIQKYSHIRLTSEKDDGVFDAMNKGIMSAHGNILGFLNSDDTYEPNIFREIMMEFHNDPAIMAISGGATVISSEENSALRFRYFPPVGINEIGERTTLGSPIFNAWFFRKEVFSNIGLLDTRYKLISDRDFLIQVAIKKPCYRCINKNLYNYYSHPNSLTIKPHNDWESSLFQEISELCRRYLSQPGFDLTQRKFILQWYRKVMLEMTVAAFHKNRYLRVARYIIQAVRYDPVWIFSFISRIYRHISGRLKQQ